MITCPVCNGPTRTLGAVDFNKSCEEARGRYLPPADIPVEYRVCDHCGFCFAPELYRWSLDTFDERIYNEDYEAVDPDYREVRPKANAHGLLKLFTNGEELRHLDYGGGNGLLSELLRDAGWQSASYDPFVDRDVILGDFGKFDLVTAFEVFEHVPDPGALVSAVAGFLDADGLIVFSTLVSDGHLDGEEGLRWWYVGPRNGHISVYSRRSLFLLGQRVGLNFGSFSPNLHAYWRAVPAWARHLITA